jgi:hypothetical protein
MRNDYMDKQIRHIFSRKMAIYLQLRGHVLLSVHDRSDTNYKVFIFSESEKIKLAMKDYNNDKGFEEVLQKYIGG